MAEDKTEYQFDFSNPFQMHLETQLMEMMGLCPDSLTDSYSKLLFDEFLSSHPSPSHYPDDDDDADHSDDLNNNNNHHINNNNNNNNSGDDDD